MIPLPIPTMYLYAAAFAGGLVAGGFGVHTWYKAQKVEAIQEARAVERAGVRVGHQADIRYIDRLHENTEKANARATVFQAAFNTAADGLRRCAVAPDLLRLLNDAGEKPTAGATGKPESAAAPTQAGSNCAAVVDTYRWNIDNVIEPNRIQIEELQRFYNDVRRKFNR